MMTERPHNQLKMYTLTIEDMVPHGHFLRKVDKLIDFNFIYDEVRELYSHRGRPSIDPLILIKTLLLGYMYGIDSERQLEMEIQVNIAYRWFLQIDLDERVPDHSTMSANRRRRFNGTDIFRKLFETVLSECIRKGLVDGKLVMTDSTHIKASASRESEIKLKVEKEASAYISRLDKHEALERSRLEAEGKLKPKGLSCKPRSKVQIKTVSTTDPDAGLLGRPGKPLGMHYLDHQSIDSKCGVIVDVEVTSGNTNDCTPYLDRIEFMQNKVGIKIEAVALDSGYDTSLIHREMEDNNITVFTPSTKKQDKYKVKFKRDAFRYNEIDDVFLCPNGKTLRLRQLERFESNIVREYAASAKDCRDCPCKDKCLAPSQESRRVRVNIFENVVRKHHEHDGTCAHTYALNQRQIWCEGTFANQIKKHNLRGLSRRGLAAARDHCLLSATALNLKRLVMRAG